MNKDLIETPRFNFFIGDEVLLKGKIVGFDVDENKCVENVVRLEYGQTLNVPNNNIYITDDIVDKSKIKVVVPQCVAEYIEFKKKNNFHVYGAMRVIEDHYDKKVPDWFYENNIEKFCLAWLNGYEVEKEKRYFVKIKGRAAFSPSNPCEVTVTIYSPTKSKLDPPNLYPTVKAIIDGMTDAGIWTDDNHKVIKKLSFVYGGLSEEKGHYRLEFDIEEVENE
ncbi:phage Holliday junction resolvase [Streptococcus pneumoniae]|nr:phage Holliday junction resolvase [Streptococcus pneumoniae]